MGVLMSKFSFERKAFMQILTNEQIETIHEKALSYLEQYGVRFLHEGALDFLKEKGCDVDKTSQMVKFPRELVIEAIKNAPESFDMYNCRGERTMSLGQGHSYFAPGPGSPNITDADTKMRRAEFQDFEEALMIAEDSANYSIVSGSVVPGDIPESVADVYILYQAIKKSNKTILGESWDEGSEKRIAKLIEAVCGSKEAFAEKPFMMLAACPSPPMKWDGHVIDNAIMCMDYGVPVFVNSSPVMGISAPITHAGGVLVHTIENLSFITFMQLMHPGTPILYGGICATMDMRTMYSSQSAAEACLCTAGYAAMSKYYGIPSLAFLAQTDAKIPDYQGGFETAMGSLISVLAGIDVIYGAGTVDSYLSSSNVKLAMDGDLLGYIKMIGNGIEVTEDTLAENEIITVGCGDTANYLAQAHTMMWFRKQQYMNGNIINRSPRATWESGEQDIVKRAENEIAAMQEKQKNAFDDDFQVAVDAAMEDIKKELGLDF